MITSKYPCALALSTGLSITPCLNSFYTSEFVKDVYHDGECLSFENQITLTTIPTIREYVAVGLSGWCIYVSGRLILVCLKFTISISNQYVNINKFERQQCSSIFINCVICAYLCRDCIQTL